MRLDIVSTIWKSALLILACSIATVLLLTNQTQQSFAEQKWSAADRQRLFAYVDTYNGAKVIADPAVQPRLQRLLGPELEHLKKDLEVEGPMGIMDGVLFVEGNAPHRGDVERGLLGIRLYSGGVYAALYTRDEIRVYGRDENIWTYTFNQLPKIVQYWVIWQSNCHMPCPMPSNVGLKFGPP